MQKLKEVNDKPTKPVGVGIDVSGSEYTFVF